MDSRFVTTSSLSKRIRDCSAKHYNYMVTVGDSEVKNRVLSIRKRGEKETKSLSPEEFEAKLRKELEVFA